MYKRIVEIMKELQGNDVDGDSGGLLKVEKESAPPSPVVVGLLVMGGYHGGEERGPQNEQRATNLKSIYVYIVRHIYIYAYIYGLFGSDFSIP